MAMIPAMMTGMISVGRTYKHAEEAQWVLSLLRGKDGRGRRTLDDEIRPQDTHGRDTDAGFCSTIGGAEAGEDDGARAAHRSEERLSRSVSMASKPL
jgi:hypothetical protein